MGILLTRLVAQGASAAHRRRVAGSALGPRWRKSLIQEGVQSEANHVFSHSIFQMGVRPSLFTLR